MEARIAFQDALKAGPEFAEIYETLMLRFMDDVCMRSTLLLMKDSWKKYMVEFGMANDIPCVLKILKHFPEIEYNDGENQGFTQVDWFRTDADRNDDTLTMIAGSNLFDNYEGDCSVKPMPKVKSDIRSVALRVFERMWQTAMMFFRSPPQAFYLRSNKFFFAKLRLLQEYESNPQIREDMETLKGFGKEEKEWIGVEHWRKMYINKISAYFHGQLEEWRLENAMNHSYFKNGMKLAATPPQSVYDTEMMELVTDDATTKTMKKALLRIMKLSDTALANESTSDPLVTSEMERRNCAREALFIIANRWGMDVTEVFGF